MGIGIEGNVVVIKGQPEDADVNEMPFWPARQLL
jgi:hypothetical protein